MKLKNEQEIENLADSEHRHLNIARKVWTFKDGYKSGYTQAQKDLLSQASEGFEEYIDYITSGRRLRVNRLDLHKQTWQAAKLSSAKEIENRREEMIRLNTLLGKTANDHLIEAHKVENLLKENEELRRMNSYYKHLLHVHYGREDLNE